MSPLAKTTITLAAAAGFAVPALASSEPSTHYTKEVPYGDLNLASAEGQAMLDKRVARAAGQVCRTLDGPQAALCRFRARKAAAPAIKVATSRATGQNLAAREARASAIVGN